MIEWKSDFISLPIVRDSFKIFQGSIYFWVIRMKQYNHLRHIALKESPCWTAHFCQRLWNYLKHSWKPCCESLFSSHVAFLVMSVASQMRRPFNVEFSTGTGKSRLEPGQENMGDATVLSHWSLLGNPSPKQAGVLEHCRKQRPTIGFPFFGAFRSDASLRRRRISMYIPLLLGNFTSNSGNFWIYFLKKFYFIGFPAWCSMYWIGFRS